MPFNCIPVVGRKLVMKVVVSFAKSDEGGDDVIPGRVAVIEWLVTEPMSQGVDAKGSLLDEEDAQNAAIDEATEPIAPSKATYERGKDETHEEHDFQVVSVLPDNDGVFIEIRDVGAANAFRVLFHEHPAKVRVQQALTDRVWVLVGVGIAVVSTVVTSPPSDRAFDGTATNGSEEDAERQGGRIGGMGPKAVIAYEVRWLASIPVDVKS